MNFNSIVAALTLSLAAAPALAQDTDYQGAERASQALLRVENHHDERVDLIIDGRRHLTLGPGEAVTTSAFKPGWIRLDAKVGGETLDVTRMRLVDGETTTWAIGDDATPAATATLELVNISDGALKACLDERQCLEIYPHTLVRIMDLSAGAHAVEIFEPEDSEAVDTLRVDLADGDTYRWSISPELSDPR